MFDHILLLTTIFLAIVFFRLIRRSDAQQNGYILIVGAEFTIALVGLFQADSFWGQLAIYMSILTIGIPWLLEGIARQLFNRGRMAIAVRLMSLRAILMPGSGLVEQQQVLYGILILEQKGVDAALAYFRKLVKKLAHQQDETEIMAMVHEQIVSMLFYDLRWDEGIAYYEGRFQRGYAAMRPMFALGLLRAYGEAGKLDHAAKLLHALEEGPLATDPRAMDLLGQARLTFLAYAGSVNAIDQILGKANHYKILGLSQASGAFFYGIALARDGQIHRAKAELQRVHTLASPKEERMVAASKFTLAQLRENQGITLEPELRRYVKLVGERLYQLLQTSQRIVYKGPAWATLGLMVSFIAGYLLTISRLPAGMMGLASVGALSSDLWQAGLWWRAITANFLHIELVGVAINIYAVWLSGQMLERVLGTSRTALIAIWGGVFGMVMAAVLTPDTTTLLGGSHGMTTALIVGALWTLVPMRSPKLSSKQRKGMALTFVFLLGAQILACLPDALGLVTKPIALISAACIATLLSWVLPVRLARWTTRLVQIAAAGSIALIGFAVYQTARENPQAFPQQTNKVQYQGVELNLPAYFQQTSPNEQLPIKIFAEGLVDQQSLRMGDLIEVMVVLHKETDKDELGTPKLIARFPHLLHEFRIGKNLDIPAETKQILDDAEDSWSTYTLRRNGVDVVRVIERNLQDRSVVLLSSPISLLTHSPEFYASIIADAQLTK